MQTFLVISAPVDDVHTVVGSMYMEQLFTSTYIAKKQLLESHNYTWTANGARLYLLLLYKRMMGRISQCEWQASSLKKHLGYSNHIFRLSEWH